jgi:2-polyprenyl-3-methyl-5-hydroxy-6-metoxy-1,4-benzoquinol methylase
MADRLEGQGPSASPSGSKALAENYEEIYEKASAVAQQTDPEEVLFFADLVPKGRTLKVLDIGCGEGRLSVLLAQRGHDVTAMDVSEGFLEQARCLAKKDSVTVRTVKGNIESPNLALPDGKFDAIFLMDVIEHLMAPVAGLRNIRQMLKDDGILLVHTPNVLTPSRMAGYLKNRKSLTDFTNPRNIGDLHLQTYDFLTLEKTLAFSGFRVLEIVPTKLTLPVLYRFRSPSANRLFRRCSRRFPKFSDTLLLRCGKASQLDFDKVLASWTKT